MKVYRLESSQNRRGVYHAMGAYTMLLEKMGDDMVKHPTPDEDSLFVENMKAKEENVFGVRFEGGWRFAFESVAQLRAWFYNDEAVQKLSDNHDIFLAVYEVPEKDVIRGNTQLTFRAEYHKGVHLVFAGPCDVLLDKEKVAAL